MALATLAVIMVTGCGPRQTATKAAANPGGSEDGQQEVRRVRVTPAETGTISRTIEVNGTLAAQDEVAVAFKVPGRIDVLPVDLGDVVRQGQVIATLDKTDLRLAVSQAEAAHRAGIRQQHWHELESGKKDARLSTWKRAFEGLECDLMLVPKPRRHLGEWRARRMLEGHYAATLVPNEPAVLDDGL